MNRVRICGQTTNRYEQIIELSDEELQQFRNDLDHAKNKGDQSINDFLGGDYGDTEPIDWEYGEWEAELIDADGAVTDNLDYL